MDSRYSRNGRWVARYPLGVCTARRKKTFDDYLKEQIRRLWTWTEEYKKAKARAVVARANGDFLYRCEECGSSPLTSKEKDVDHIEPIENPLGWDGWDNYIRRARVPIDGLKILCKPCHYKKSAAENAIRRKVKRANKTT